MKTILVLSLLGLLASNASAHYVFSFFIVNGTETPQWKYVRDVIGDPDNAQNEVPGSVANKMHPQYKRESEAMACGRMASLAAKTTETADVVAGTEVGFHIQHEFDGSNTGFSWIFHKGPAQGWLARAPNDDLANFNGTDGDWFKIAEIFAEMRDTTEYAQWKTYGKTSVNFTIPKAVPAGKYLLRIEHFMGEQFYVNCAHVNILSTSTATIAPEYFAKFPGEYKYNDPRIDINYTIWENPPDRLLQYVGPGPKLWTGEHKKSVTFKA